MSDTTFGLIEQERRRLADLAEAWSTQQWDTPSLADGWRVREVVAHLTMPFGVGIPAMALGLLRARGSFDRFADRWARQTAASVPAEETAARLRTHAASRFTPPGMGPEAPLTDVVVHGLDVRVPLGLDVDDIAAEARVAALGFVSTRAGRRFGVPADSFAGRRLEATDVDWSHGDGPTQRATSAELLVHLCRGLPLAAPIGS